MHKAQKYVSEQENKMIKKKSNRGWSALVVGIIVTFLFQGLVSHQQGLLLEPISSSLGMPRTLYSSLDSLTQTFNMLCSLSFAFFYAKLGLKKIVCIGAFGPIVYCAGLVSASYLPGVSAVLIGIAQASLGVYLAFTSVVCVSTLINNWFAKRRGLMISITQAAAGLGGTLFAPIIQSWIANESWQMSLIYRGAICLVGAIVICVIIKSEPDKDEARIWEEQSDDSELVAEVSSGEGIDFSAALKMSSFWIVAIFCLCGGAFGYVPSACLAAYGSDCGFVDHVGTLSSVVFGVTLIATLPMGSLIEKFGARKVLTPILIALCVGCALISVPNPKLSSFYIAAVCFGLSFCLITVPIPMITKELFGDKDFSKIQSIIFAFAIGGCIVGYPLYNLGYDLLGTYSPVYLANAVIAIVMIVLLFMATKKKIN